jgi:predicted permease
MNLWSALRHWHRRDAEIDEELRSHVSMDAQDRVERGESPEQAAESAHREFGNLLLVKESTREVWGWATVERYVQDLKYALRQMRRSPGFTLAAVLTLALGLGATTAMFSIVNGVLLAPLKFPQPDRLYRALTIVAPRFKANSPYPVNARHFSEWRAHGQSWEQIAMVDGLGATITGQGEPQRIFGWSVSYNLLKTLGIQPALGRDFRPEEELPGNSNVVMLSRSLWQSRFASSASVVGQSIVLDGVPHLVVGILPETLKLPNISEPMILRPLGFDVSQSRGYGQYDYYSIMRLKPDVQPQAAIGEMNALIADLVRQFKIESKPGLAPLLDQATAEVRPALWLLFGAVGVVLLIVCVNVGNLMLLRTGSRLREAGVRMALGASKARLFGLALMEAAALVGIGGLLGLVFANLAIGAFVAAAPISLPRLDEVRIDWRVLSFSCAAMALSALICGFIPAWRLSKTAPLDALRAGSANLTELDRRLRLREVIVGVEVALSTLLLVVGGLLIVSFIRVIASDKGFDVARVVTQNFALTGSRYTKQRQARFIEDALPQLASLPGVEAVSLTNQIPLGGQNLACGLRDPDHLLDPAHPDSASNFAGLANYQYVAPGFWRTMGIPVSSGRGLEEQDRDRRLAVVSERVARTLWPDRNPIGKRIMTCGSLESAILEVIGVAGDARTTAEQEPPLTIYQPYWDIGVEGGSFVLRTKGNPAAVTGALREVLRSLDPDLPIAPARTVVEVLDRSVAPRRFEMYLAATFAAAALILASIGIYGIVSFSVARRTPEIGIRMALGAAPRQLIGMVIQQGLLPVLGGLAAGLIAALGVGRFVANQLFGVSPHDPLTISLVAVLLLLVAVGACLIPARRAIRIDPVRALRFE